MNELNLSACKSTRQTARTRGKQGAQPSGEFVNLNQHPALNGEGREAAAGSAEAKCREAELSQRCNSGLEG